MVPSWYCERGISVRHLWTGLGGLLQNLETVQKGNTGIELSDGFFTFSNLTPTYVFLFLHFAVRILPYVLDIIVVFLARRLLAAMKENLYQEESVKLAEKPFPLLRVDLSIHYWAGGRYLTYYNCFPEQPLSA